MDYRLVISNSDGEVGIHNCSTSTEVENYIIEALRSPYGKALVFHVINHTL